MYRILCYNDAYVILASIQNSRHKYIQFWSFGDNLMGIWQHVNAWYCPHDSNFQISFPNIFTFQVFRNTPRKCYIHQLNLIIPFIQRYHLRQRFVSPFFFPHTSVKQPDARLQNCKACGPINCWEGLINWGPFLTLGWDKILTPTWLFTYQKYCFFWKRHLF